MCVHSYRRAFRLFGFEHHELLPLRLLLCHLYMCVCVRHELVEGVTHWLRSREEVYDERTDSASRSVVVKYVCVRRISNTLATH